MHQQEDHHRVLFNSGKPIFRMKSAFFILVPVGLVGIFLLLAGPIRFFYELLTTATVVPKSLVTLLPGLLFYLFSAWVISSGFKHTLVTEQAVKKVRYDLLFRKRIAAVYPLDHYEGYRQFTYYPGDIPQTLHYVVELTGKAGQPTVRLCDTPYRKKKWELIHVLDQTLQFKEIPTEPHQTDEYLDLRSFARLIKAKCQRLFGRKGDG